MRRMRKTLNMKMENEYIYEQRTKVLTANDDRQRSASKGQQTIQWNIM